MAMCPAERKRRGAVSAKEIVTMALCAALLLVAQVALAPLPNIELVSLLVVLYTLFFRWRTLFILYAFVLLEGLLYGFGLWWINYLYVWTALWAAAMLLYRMRGAAGWVLLLAGYGLLFGFLCSFVYLFAGGPKAAFGYFISGIPFDLAHCAGNAVIGAVLFRPLRKLFTRFMPGVS